MFNCMRRLDYLLGRIAASGLYFRHNDRRIIPSRIAKILCIKLWGLGNLAIIYPLLPKIKEKFPDAQLMCITFDTNRGFLENNEAVDRVIYFKFTTNIFQIITQCVRLVIELRKQKIDLLINFETFNSTAALFSYLTKASVRIGLNNEYESIFYTHSVENDTSKHISQVFSDLLTPLEGNSSYGYFNFMPKRFDQDKIKSVLTQYGVSKFMCIHPGTGSNFTGKRYRKEYFSVLASTLVGKYGIPIFFTGTQKEQKVAADIIKMIPNKENIFDLTARLTIWELVELLRKSFLFVSSDTGPVHIAASLGVNVVVFYGPTAPGRYGPLNKNSLIFYKNTPCSPCAGVHYTYGRCKNFRCLDFPPDEVIERISRFFLKPSPSMITMCKVG